MKNFNVNANKPEDNSEFIEEELVQDEEVEDFFNQNAIKKVILSYNSTK